MSSGPVIAAMRRCPSSMRWRVAARPPDQFAEPTDGASGDGSPAGSTITKGIARDRRRSRYSGASSENTSTMPTGRRRMTPSIQSGSGACRLPLTVSTTLSPLALATDSTPSMSSIDQIGSSSWKTSSMSSAWDSERPPPRRR